MRHWDEFYGGPNMPSDKRMHITLSRTGNILLNAKAFETLGEPDTVVLLFDKRNSVIGLRPADHEVAHSFPLTTKRGVRHKLIRAIPFCRHHRIKVERTVAFPEAQIESDGTLLLDLHTAIEIGRTS